MTAYVNSNNPYSTTQHSHGLGDNNQGSTFDQTGNSGNSGYTQGDSVYDQNAGGIKGFASNSSNVHNSGTGSNIEGHDKFVQRSGALDQGSNTGLGSDNTNSFGSGNFDQSNTGTNTNFNHQGGTTGVGPTDTSTPYGYGTGGGSHTGHVGASGSNADNYGIYSSANDNSISNSDTVPIPTNHDGTIDTSAIADEYDTSEKSKLTDTDLAVLATGKINLRRLSDAQDVYPTNTRTGVSGTGDNLVGTSGRDVNNYGASSSLNDGSTANEPTVPIPTNHDGTIDTSAIADEYDTSEKSKLTDTDLAVLATGKINLRRLDDGPDSTYGINEASDAGTNNLTSVKSIDEDVTSSGKINLRRLSQSDGTSGGRRMSSDSGRRMSIGSGRRMSIGSEGKVPIKDKILGTVDTIVGKITNNPAKVEQGEARKTGVIGEETGFSGFSGTNSNLDRTTSRGVAQNNTDNFGGKADGSYGGNYDGNFGTANNNTTSRGV